MRKIMTALSISTLAAFGAFFAANGAQAMPSVEYSYPSADKDSEHTVWERERMQAGTDVRQILKNEARQSGYPHPNNDGDSDLTERDLIGMTPAMGGNTAETR